MLNSLAAGILLLTGLFFLALGVLALAQPQRVSAFLLGFAGSAALHYLELAARLLIGAAFVLRAPDTAFPLPFTAFGWLLLITTAGLALVPWQLHRRFAARSVPMALRFLPMIGLGALILGALVLYGLLATGQ